MKSFTYAYYFFFYFYFSRKVERVQFPVETLWGEDIK